MRPIRSWISSNRIATGNLVENDWAKEDRGGPSMVNFMADLRKKYVFRSAVALVETHSFGIPFRSFFVFWWHREI